METKKCVVCGEEFTARMVVQVLCGKPVCRSARMKMTSQAYYKENFERYQKRWKKVKKIDPKAPFFRCHNCAYYMRRGETKCDRCGWTIKKAAIR